MYLPTELFVKSTMCGPHPESGAVKLTSGGASTSIDELAESKQPLLVSAT